MISLRMMALACAAVVVAIGAAGLPATTTFAYDPTSTAAVNVDASKLALRGYDPVAYFTVGAPSQGSAEFTAEHDGAVYHFANAANRDTFLADPAKYAPAYGGFCAMGAALNKKLDGDPTIWKIVDGRLYLNVHPEAAKKWQEDIPANISKAEKNWAVIKDKTPNSL